MNIGNVANSINLRDHPNDVFYTPEELAIWLINQVPFDPDNDTISDPFAGKFVFYDNFPVPAKNKHWCEINEGEDFWADDTKTDWIITNPPFSQLTEILVESTNRTKKGFAYLIPSYALSFSRIKKLQDFGFYLHRVCYFENPKEWQIGFQMVFAVWQHFTVTNIDNPHQISVKYENATHQAKITQNFFSRSRPGERTI